MNTLRVKESFFRFFIKIIGNVLKFLKVKRGSQENESCGISEIFDMDSYLKSVDNKKIGFLSEFSKTQCFTYLLERTQKCFREKNELTFFVEGVRLKQTKGEKALDQEIMKISSKLSQNYKKVLIQIL
jgi:hypothetical protein